MDYRSNIVNIMLWGIDVTRFLRAGNLMWIGLIFTIWFRAVSVTAAAAAVAVDEEKNKTWRFAIYIVKAYIYQVYLYIILISPSIDNNNHRNACTRPHLIQNNFFYRFRIRFLIVYIPCVLAISHANWRFVLDLCFPLISFLDVGIINVIPTYKTYSP